MRCESLGQSIYPYYLENRWMHDPALPFLKSKKGTLDSMSE